MRSSYALKRPRTDAVHHFLHDFVKFRLLVSLGVMPLEVGYSSLQKNNC